jgi:hypothetical protein
MLEAHRVSRTAFRPIVFVSILVMMASPPGALYASDDATNFVENPGFEIPWMQEDDGLLTLHGSMLEPTHWWPRYADRRTAVYRWDQRLAFSGSCSVHIDTRRQNSAVPGYEAWSAFIDAHHLAGSQISLRAMVTTENLDDSACVEFRVHAFRDGIAAGDPCGAAARMTSDAPTWTEHVVSFTVPQEADRLIVQLGIHGRGQAWFDQASLTVDEGADPSATWGVNLADPRLIYVMDTVDVIRASLTPPTEPLDEKPWTVLLYAAADFRMAFTPLEDFTSHVWSNPRVNVLVLEDYVTRGASIWFVDRPGMSTRITAVLELGEAEMDEPGALEQFLAFAKQWYPAERTLLYFYGHGHGWWGACNDISNDTTTGEPAPTDWLTPVEMRAALETVGGVDAVMFSAPCAMSSLETAYELRDVTTLYVADEELSGYALWRNAVAPIAASLAADPTQDSASLAQMAIRSIRDTVQAQIESGSPFVKVQPAIAATLTSELSGLAASLDAFSIALIEALPLHREAIAAARGGSADFAYGELVDLYAFAELCTEIPGLEEAASSALHAVDAMVIERVSPHVGTGTARGLSLYFPLFEDGVSDAVAQMGFAVAGGIYRDYGLSLLVNTHWYDFLLAFFGS